MLTILVIVPLLIAALISLFISKHPKYVKYVALAASLISLLLILNAFVSRGGTQTATWFTLSGYSFTLTTSTMPLNILLLSILGVMTPLILLYSIGFMNLPTEQSRYYTELLVFAAAMMLFAIAGDFITMLIGWELLGITSYLLIGFWYGKEGSATAARKAITTILIGDILMFSAMIIIWSSYHTFSFALILQQSTTSGLMPIALLLIIFAVFTKSAQFPFHEWLPDAMKGPTPVSAFLHSSTMVKAGVFLVAVLLPLFIAYHMLNILLIFGLVTAALGVLNAIAESNIKRVLAYSTIEDLGLMFVALGLGSIEAAMVLFVVQTFYKALLFMNAGSMIRANEGEEEMDRMYNMRSNLLIFIPIIIGVVSLAGLYPLSGFFGKVGVSSSANNIGIYAILLAIELASSIYIFRWLFLPLHKKPERKMKEARANYKSTPISMMLPIYILAIAAAAAGFVVYSYLPSYLAQYGSVQFPLGLIEIGASTLVIIAGLLISYAFFYLKNHYFGQSITYKLLYNSLVTNKIYLLITQLALLIAGVIEGFDRVLYNIVKGAAHNFSTMGNSLKKMETGSTTTYIAAFIIGMIIILAIFVLW